MWLTGKHDVEGDDEQVAAHLVRVRVGVGVRVQARVRVQVKVRVRVRDTVRDGIGVRFGVAAHAG